MAILKALDDIMPYFLDNPSDLWKFGNSVLYEMCVRKPSHNDIDIVAGKLWIIGRTYAAAIERRKNDDNSDTDRFYYDTAAPKLLSIGSELDERLEQLNSYKCPTTDNLGELLDTHKFLTNAFYEITSLEKRSLASKYLHFHCPNMFYIYDSRADAAIKKYAKKDAKLLEKYTESGCDMIYGDFCVRALELQKFVKEKYGRLLTPREIDNLLLYY